MSEREFHLLTLLEEDCTVDQLKKASKLKPQELFLSLLNVLDYKIENHIKDDRFVDDVSIIIFKISELVDSKQIPKSYGNKIIKRCRKNIAEQDNKYMLKLINARLGIIQERVITGRRTREFETEYTEIDNIIFKYKNIDETMKTILEEDFDIHYSNNMHLIFHLVDEYLEEVRLNQNQKHIAYYKSLIDRVLVVPKFKLNLSEIGQLKYELEKIVETTKRNKNVKTKKLILNHISVLVDKIINRNLILFKTRTDVSYTGNRTDLTKEYTISIDSPETRMFDDALTIKTLPNGNLMYGIHIADPNSTYAQLSINDDLINALNNKQQIDGMCIFKNTPSLKALSLKRNECRPTKSLMIEITPKGEIVEQKFIRAIISVNQNLTYQEVDRIIQTKDVLNPNYEIVSNLSKIALKLREKNKTKEIYTGLKILLRDPRKLSANFDIEKFNFSNSRMTVQESMILYNTIVANHFEENDLPILYKNKKGIDSVFHDTEEVNSVTKFLKKQGYTNAETIKGMLSLYPAGNYSTFNIGNSSLQLKAYTNASSPLRYDADKLISMLIDQFYFQKPSDKTYYKTEEALKLLGPYMTNKSRTETKERQIDASNDAREYLLKIR